MIFMYSNDLVKGRTKFTDEHARMTNHEVLIWQISEKCKAYAMDDTPVIVIQGEAIWLQNLTYSSKVVIEIIIWI